MGLVAGASTPTGGKSKEITVTGDTLWHWQGGRYEKNGIVMEAWLLMNSSREKQFLLHVLQILNVSGFWGTGFRMFVVHCCHWMSVAWLQGCCLPVLFSATAAINKHQNISSYLNHFHHLSPNRKHDITYKMWFHESCLKPLPCFPPSLKSHSTIQARVSPKYNPILQ